MDVWQREGPTHSQRCHRTGLPIQSYGASGSIRPAGKEVIPMTTKRLDVVCFGGDDEVNPGTFHFV
jgi:hypothetical protein